MASTEKEKKGKHVPTKLSRIIAFITILTLIIGIIYVGLLCFPDPFFKNKIQRNNITLYSDAPIPDNANKILDQISTLIGKSAIYDKNIKHKIYVCNNVSTFKFFANKNGNVGGIDYVYFNQSIFLRPADFESNKLFGPSGNKVEGDRPLSYFLAHEITHTLTVRRIGRAQYYDLPVWIREGYADYVGKGAVNFDDYLKKFSDNVKEMNPSQSGLYMRYHLFVMYLLEKKNMKIDELLHSNLTDQDIEKEVKEYIQKNGIQSQIKK